MASSKLMASTSTTNTDLPRQPSSICSPLSNLLSDPSRTVSSMNMDDLLKNLYPDPSAAGATAQQFHHQNQPPPPPQGLDPPQSFPGASISEAAAGKTVDEVWKEIVAGSDQRGGDGGGGGDGGEEMTLEDFLTKAGAVREDDVRVPVVPYGVDAAAMAGGGGQFQGGVEGAIVAFRNGIDGRVVAAAAPGPGGRGKRKPVEEPPVDKATQQKQRRMIKNRESAARSRERKQAYTVELESLVTQLEEENARLRREEVEHNKERLKQLMETVIPVSEKRRPPRTLRRVNSMQW